LFFLKDYCGENLLDTDGEPNKFALNVFRKLFTHEERFEGIIENVGKKNKSKRPLLCNDKVTLLKRAIEIKFSIAPDKRLKHWRKMRAICNRHCYDLNPLSHDQENTDLLG
jgi:hypothetical protein